jgi:hypothetical protein
LLILMLLYLLYHDNQKQPNNEYLLHIH